MVDAVWQEAGKSVGRSPACTVLLSALRKNQSHCTARAQLYPRLPFPLVPQVQVEWRKDSRAEEQTVTRENSHSIGDRHAHGRLLGTLDLRVILRNRLSPEYQQSENWPSCMDG